MLLHKQEGQRAEWEYPFAVAGVNISFMLVQMLDLQSSNFLNKPTLRPLPNRSIGVDKTYPSLAGMPTTKAGLRFLELLAEDESAFDNLYCVAFCLMDAQWLAKRASYMEFNVILSTTSISRDDFFPPFKNSHLIYFLSPYRVSLTRKF